MSIYLGTTIDVAHRIGTASVDTLRAWVLDLKNTPADLQPTAASIVTVISTRGGQTTAPAQIK